MKSGGEPTNRERARLIYLRSGCKKSLPTIAKEIGVSYDTVKSWKRRDKWDEDPRAVSPGASAPAPAPKDAPENAPAPKRKRGGQPGNRNAVGNSGGGPPGNQNAVTTGEYARLLFSDLTEDERALLASIPECTIDLMRHDLALLCVREKRMLGRIARLQASADEETGLIYSEITSHHSTHVKNGNTDTTDTTDTTVAPAIDRISDIEEALTRVRREKQRIIAAINEYEIKQATLSMEKERHERQYGSSDEDGRSITIIYDYGDEESEGAEE
jgi:uncharacterized protein YjcR